MSHTLKTLIGNSVASAQALRMIENGRIPQSLLITGPCPLATEEFAMSFATSVLTRQDAQGRHQAKCASGHHPDLYLLRPEGKSNQYTMETIRTFQSLLNLPPTEALNKIFILFEAERMLPVTANALLKSVEEPARDAVIMLVSQAQERLLPTLRSRCQRFVLRPLADQEIAVWLKTTMGLEERVAQHLARFAEGSKQRALSLYFSMDRYQDALLPLLQAMSQGHATYVQIHEVTGKLTEIIEAYVKHAGDKQTTAQARETTDYRSALQRHAQEKQEAGESASLLREAFHLLCIHILAYFRDLQAVEVGAAAAGNPLYYPHLLSSSPSASSFAPPLEHMEARIEAANALLDRFTPLKTCIEQLFVAV